MISLQKSFLFVHVPKTGGNSIQDILQRYSEDKVVSTAPHHDGLERFEIRNDRYNIHKHAPLNTYKRELEKQVYDSLFKFSTIRNPWDMVISAYFSPHHGEREWNREAFLEMLGRFPSLRDFIRADSAIAKVAKKMGLDVRFGRLDADMDFLLRFEHLNDDFKMLCEKIEIPYTPLPVRNASKKKHYSSYYDEELKKVVEEKFREEIKFGNYVFDSRAAG